MRLVLIDQIQGGERLGRDVHVGPSTIPLLRKGVHLSTRYVEGLRDAGVRGIWVDDAVSAGIEPIAPISEQTRLEAKQALTSAFETVVGSPAGVTFSESAVAPLRDVAAKIVADVLACGDATILVPGHGDPLHDMVLLRATMAVMRELLRGGKEARARGLDPDQAREELFPRLHDLMVRITGDEPKANDQFKTYLVDWYLHRVYDELNGPLTDAISAIPPR